MKGNGAFHRALAMVAAVAAVIARTGTNYAAQRAQLDALGPYQSRGKGGKHPHRSVGTKAHQRAAKKARSVRRNRSH